MQAERIIESNTKAHIFEGRASWHMVASAHEKSIRDLCAKLNVLSGVGQTPQVGCIHAQMSLGDAKVLVEFEVEPASGDGWNEPREERSVQPIGVLLNGVWCDAQDVIPDATLKAWAEQALADEEDAVEQDRIRAYEASREDAGCAA